MVSRPATWSAIIAAFDAAQSAGLQPTLGLLPQLLEHPAAAVAVLLVDDI